MPKLGMLEIVGPVTECNKAVRVRHAVIGATVEIFSVDATGKPTSIAKGTAHWPEQSFTASKLKAGIFIVALQTLKGFSGSDVSASVEVQGPPTATQLSQGAFFKPFHVCARCVWLSGLVPGAEVRVLSGDELLGTAMVNEDGAVQVALNRGLVVTDRLAASLTGCNGTTTPATKLIKGGAPATLPDSLKPPVVAPGLVCDPSIHVSGLVPGAHVTLSRGGKELEGFCWALDSMDFILSEDLHLTPAPTDDPIGARQSFGAPCNLKSAPATAKVSDKPPETPKILDPLCGEQEFIKVSGLRPGATVEITVAAGEPLLFGAEKPLATFPLATPLPPKKKIEIRQSMCGNKGWSGKGVAFAGSLDPERPTLTSPPSSKKKVSVKPVLLWKDPATICNVAQSFDLQISETAFGLSAKMVVDVTGLKAPNHTLTTALKHATKYFWRVRSHRNTSVSDWSLLSNFTTAAAEEHGETGPQPDDADVVRKRCFIQDCCATTGTRKLVSATGTSMQAQAILNDHLPTLCSLSEEVPCNTVVPGCSEIPK